MELMCVKDMIEYFSDKLLLAQHVENKNFFYSGVENKAEARKEIAYLLAFVLRKDKVFLLTHGSHVLSEQETAMFSRLFARRLQGEPLAYLLGKKEFFGYEFLCNGSTLIPRPDTELLVEEALGFFSAAVSESPYVCDMGTGTGCILLSIMKEEKRCVGIGVDINEEAVALAKKNAVNLGLAERALFFADDFADKNFADRLLAKTGGKKIHCLISNPPYIPDFEYERLDISVKNFEPKTALLSYENSCGTKGLYHAEALLLLGERVLESGGLLLMEHGYNQGRALRDLCAGHAYHGIKTCYDLGGNERALFAVRK